MVLMMILHAIIGDTTYYYWWYYIPLVTLHTGTIIDDTTNHYYDDTTNHYWWHDIPLLVRNSLIHWGEHGIVKHTELPWQQKMWMLVVTQPCNKYTMSLDVAYETCWSEDRQERNDRKLLSCCRKCYGFFLFCSNCLYPTSDSIQLPTVGNMVFVVGVFLTLQNLNTFLMGPALYNSNTFLVGVLQVLHNLDTVVVVVLQPFTMIIFPRNGIIIAFHLSQHI